MKASNTKSILWQLFLVLLPIPITVWLTIQATNQPDNINYLTYYKNENLDFISIPNEVEDKVGITYNGEVIENLSVVRYYIFNPTNRNLSNLQLHFEIQSNNNKEYTLISNSLYGPDDYPKAGVHPIKSEDPNIYIYKIDSLNRSEEEAGFLGDTIILRDTFVAEFVFLGSDLPEIKISTSNTGIKVRDISKTGETTNSNILDTIVFYVSYNWQFLSFIIMFVLFIVIYVPFTDKVARHRIRHSLKQYLESLGKVELSESHIQNIVTLAEQLYKKYTYEWEGVIAPIKSLIKREKLDD